jgi:hypothetical protein
MRKPCCGASGTCACRIEDGRMIEVLGSGTAQEPWVVNSLVSLSTEPTKTFNIGLFGSGDLDSPWMLRVAYADTAELTDLPDVEADAPLNGQVLTWNTDHWEPAPGVVAAPGAILHGTGLSGDGSAAAPLTLLTDEARYITITTSGIGLNDAGINRMVRVFANPTARAAADPPPVQNTLSLLESDPTSLDMYDGSEWVRVIGDNPALVVGGELLALSGAYAGGRVTQYAAQISRVTDPTGVFVVIDPDDLVDYSGVLTAQVQPVGLGGSGWHARLVVSGGVVSALARRDDTGEAYAGATVTATVSAVLY